MTSMMGDNVEHVITYWMVYQQFHSPALAGFAVIKRGGARCASATLSSS
jgi:hypothetical protein